MEQQAVGAMVGDMPNALSFRGFVEDLVFHLPRGPGQRAKSPRAKGTVSFGAFGRPGSRQACLFGSRPFREAPQPTVVKRTRHPHGMLRKEGLRKDMHGKPLGPKQNRGGHIRLRAAIAGKAKTLV